MSRYDPIRDLLARQTADPIVLTFGELERLTGHDLPPSASDHDAWWSDPNTHTQARAWNDAGYRASPNRAARTVTFRRLDRV